MQTGELYMHKQTHTYEGYCISTILLCIVVLKTSSCGKLHAQDKIVVVASTYLVRRANMDTVYKGFETKPVCPVK